MLWPEAAYTAAAEATHTPLKEKALSSDFRTKDTGYLSFMNHQVSRRSREGYCEVFTKELLLLGSYNIQSTRQMVRS